MNPFLRAPVSPWLYPLLGVTILLLPFILSAQQSLFTKVFYDAQGDAQAYASVQTPDHGFCIAGVKDYRPLAIKTDSAGNIVWAKQMGDLLGSFRALTITGDSCLLFAGEVSEEYSPVSDLFIMKTTLGGDTLWMKTFNAGAVRQNAVSVYTTSDGGYIVGGRAENDLPPYCTALILKLDPEGDLEWGQLLSISNGSTAIFSARQLGVDGFAVTGAFEEVNSGDEKMFLLRMTMDGNVVWSNTADFAWGASCGLDVIPGSSGLTWMFSWDVTGLGLLRTSNDGTPLWCRSYGYSGYLGLLYRNAPKLSGTAEGGFVFVDGAEYGPGWGVKTDSAGHPVDRASLFLNTIGGMETVDGNYLFTGNGPILGVEMAGTDHQQIGLIKTDQLFSTSACAYSEFPFSDTCEVNLTVCSVTGTPVGPGMDLHRIFSDAVLSTDSGCVAFIGAVGNIEGGEDVSMEIYPNPSDGIVNIRLIAGSGDEKIIGLEMISSTGVTVAAIPDAGCRIDVSCLPSGLYLLRAETTSGILTKRLILQR